MNPDDTTVGPPALAETEVVSAADLAAQTAWSEDLEKSDADSPEASTTSDSQGIAWRLVVVIATAVVLMCMLIAAVIVLAAGPETTNRTDTAEPSASPQPSASAITETRAAPPVTIIETEPTVTVTEQSPAPGTSTEELPTDGTIGNGWTPQQLATSTCDVLWNTRKLRDAVEFVERNSGWSYATSRRWIERDVKATCPAALENLRR